ncbi:MAG: PHP domain-containing protein [Thermodesulfobacteriota bacterium]
MNGHIDLHVHSTRSDGTLSPTALVDLAARRQLAAIALTDHDTMAGVEEAVARGKKTGVAVLPGIEVSSTHQATPLHILGFGPDHTHPGLTALIVRLQQAREQRNAAMLDRLNHLGIAITPDELAHSGCDQIGRPHFARLLVAKGYAANSQDAFARYLKRGAAAYVEHAKPPTEEVIARITEAGGLPMLAHPASIDPSLNKVPELVASLAALGLAGLEAYYPTHTNTTRRVLQEIAARHQLLVCGGTDFHGKGYSAAPLGGSPKTMRVPIAVWQAIQARLTR